MPSDSTVSFGGATGQADAHLRGWRRRRTTSQGMPEPASQMARALECARRGTLRADPERSSHATAAPTRRLLELCVGVDVHRVTRADDDIPGWVRLRRIGTLVRGDPMSGIVEAVAAHTQACGGITNPSLAVAGSREDAALDSAACQILVACRRLPGRPSDAPRRFGPRRVGPTRLAARRVFAQCDQSTGDREGFGASALAPPQAVVVRPH